MKKKRKIWLAAALFAIVEAFAFPEILFSDCIKVKEVQQEENTGGKLDVSTWSPELKEIGLAKEKETKSEFEWKFWFLQ